MSRGRLFIQLFLSISKVRWHSQQMTSSVDRQIDQRTKDRYISLPLDTRVHKMSHLYQFRPYMVVQIDPYRKVSSISTLRT
jgi:hypothetical protein